MASRKQKATSKSRRGTGRQQVARVREREALHARLLDRIRSMSEEQLDEELRKRGRDPDQVVAEIRARIEQRLR